MPPRNADGAMTAGQCLSGYVGLLDVAGANLSQLRALIAAEKARQNAR